MISHKHEAERQQREGARAPTMRKQPLLKRSISEPAAVPPGVADRPLPPAWRSSALAGLKAVHSLIYFSIEFCMGYLIYAGLRGQEGRRTAIAAAVVAGECIIFLGNRCRCPLTGLAQSLGAARSSVTDIYLPRWLASNLAAIHVPLLVLALCLHAKNFLSRSIHLKS